MLMALALVGATGCPTPNPGDDDDATGDDDDDDDATGDDDDSTPSSCTDSSECEGWQFCDDGTCVDGDENNAPEEAESMEIDSQAAGYINPAEDMDYFSFSCVAGSHLVIYTEANPDDDPSRLDTAIQLFDSAGDMVAENDDYCASCGGDLSRLYATDSYLFWRCPDDAEYTIQIEEWSTWQTDYTPAEAPPEGSPDFFYTLVVANLNPELMEMEPNNAAGDEGIQEIGTRDPETGNFTRFSAAGEITAGTDVDIYTVPMGALGEDPNAIGLVNAWLYPLNGSTLMPNLGLWMADGVTNLFSTEITNEYRGIAAPVPVSAEGTVYALSINDSTGVEGTNDFYYMHLFSTGIINTPEDDDNDTIGTADALDSSGGSDYGRGMLELGDVDIWSVSATSGQSMFVGVGAERYGSSADITVRILDGDGNELHVETDGEYSLDPYVEGFAVPADGVYFVEFSANAVTGDWPFYYFGVTLQ